MEKRSDLVSHLGPTLRHSLPPCCIRVAFSGLMGVARLCTIACPFTLFGYSRSMLGTLSAAPQNFDDTPDTHSTDNGKTTTEVCPSIPNLLSKGREYPGIMNIGVLIHQCPHYDKRSSLLQEEVDGHPIMQYKKSIVSSSPYRSESSQAAKFSSPSVGRNWALRPGACPSRGGVCRERAD